MNALIRANDGGAAPTPPFDIADRIAAAVGGPVIVEDASFRVLGYSAFVGPMDRGRAEAILGRRIPSEWLQHLTETGSLATLRTSAEVVDLSGGPWEARRRLITSFRAHTRVLGFAWVAEGVDPLRDDAAPALRLAVDDATPELLRHLEQVDAAQEHLVREVTALLNGLPGAAAVADRLGLPRDGTFAVLSLPGQETVREGGGDPDSHTARLVEHVRMCLESLRRRAAIAPYATGVAAVVSLTNEDTEETVRRLAAEVVRLAGRGTLHPVRVAVSSLGAGFASIPRLRDEAIAAAATLGQNGGGSVGYSDVEAEVIVARVVDALPPDARLTGLDRLCEVDRGSGELERTLRAYLSSCGSVSAAAGVLGVHVTTVRHRLDRIATVSGLRLDAPEVRIACDLLLRRPLTSDSTPLHGH